MKEKKDCLFEITYENVCLHVTLMCRQVLTSRLINKKQQEFLFFMDFRVQQNKNKFL